MNQDRKAKITMAQKLLAVISILLLASCTDKFTDYNTNKAAMMEVGQKELAGLFTKAVSEAVGWQMAVMAAKYHCTMPMHLCGYSVTGYENQELNVLLVESNRNEQYGRAYNSYYKNVKVIMDVCEREKLYANLGIAKVLTAYVFHRQTDIWGPVPYSEAGVPKENIKFDSQKDVYYALFDDLRVAAGMLESELNKNPAVNAYGSSDLIYGGSVEKWLRFCNTLRLRLAMRISNIEPAKAQMEAEEAAKGIVLETNSHDGLFKTNTLTGSSGYGHGMPQMVSYVAEFMSTSMESYMKGYNDPRMAEYWSPVVEDARQPNDPNYKKNIGGYHGLTSAPKLEELVVGIRLCHSMAGPRFANGMQRVTPINVVSAAETWFLKAEGALKGWNMGGGDAKTFYNKGIECSIKQWIPNASTTVINDYTNGTVTPFAPENYPYNDAPVCNSPVKFADNRDTQYEQVMIQKWLALFPDATEAYAEVRRTRLPKLYAKRNSMNANVNPAAGQMIVRYPFPETERTTQPEEVEKAILMLGGNPDLESTPLWWDVNKNGSVNPGKY